MDYINEQIKLIRQSCSDVNIEFSEKFDDPLLWNEHSTAERRFSKLQFSEEVKRLKKRLDKLNQNIIQYQTVVATYDKTIAERQEIIISLQQKLREKSLDEENKGEILKEAEILVTQSEKGRNSSRQFSDDEYKKLEEIFALYTDGLSFKINFTRDGPVVCYNLFFTNIDCRDPHRIFSAKIRYDSDLGTCSIIECSPEINEVDDLEHLLHEDMDWHQFVVLLRKSFKKCVAN